MSDKYEITEEELEEALENIGLTEEELSSIQELSFRYARSGG